MSGARGSVHEARAAWSRLTEPGDVVAGALVRAMGPVEALGWLRESVATGARDLPADADDALTSAARLRAAVERWAPRLDGLEPRRDLDALHARGGRLLVPEAPGWPACLEDLGVRAPHALWVLGDPAVPGRAAVAVIGARASTSYGEHVAGEISTALVDAGVDVVSGGAFGIDAVAHRAALALGGCTVAVLAGGVDRPYPAANARMLAQVVRDGGALVAEVPPGSAPRRSRFLQRNRLIAALAGVTVVVEAAWRSGTLSTAGHAAELLRPVGAVPGPVTSAASAGCHRLMREGLAVCVTDGSEVLELLRGSAALTRTPHAAGPPEAAAGVLDDVEPTLRPVLDAMPLRGSVAVDHLARSAGLSLRDVRAALGRLELAGRTRRDGDRWHVTAPPNRT